MSSFSTENDLGTPPGGGLDDVGEPSDAAAFVAQLRLSLGRKFQKLLDDWTPYPRPRWGLTVCIALLYGLRVYLLAGWYIITYALAIYLLNLLIGFLTPQVDPENEPSLPTHNDDEFRPFVRRLPEFKFWYSTTKAFLIAIFCTFFEKLDIPVFWPILLLYFLVLFTIMMKKQILHMIKYKYLPFDIKKPSFKGSNNEKK